MAPSGLTAVAAGIVVLSAGAAVEHVAVPDSVSGAGDWLVGAAYVLAAVRRRREEPTETWLGMATAAAWFAATATSALDGPLAVVVGMTVLAHRGLLLHWIVRHGSGPVTDWASRVLVILGYVTALGAGAAAGTALVALALGVVLLRRSASRSARGARSAREAALLLLGIGGMWLATAAGLDRPDPKAVWLVGALLIAWWLSLPRGTARMDRTIRRLVIELGPSDRPATPLLTCLSRALADPDLQLALGAPSRGWTDELGRPAADPLAGPHHHGSTVVPTPDGGTLVLIHGPTGAGDSELSGIAAAAAALGLGRVRLVADLRRERAEAQRSAARLDAVDATERRALAEQMRSGVVALLDSLGDTWRASPDEQALAQAVDEIIAELDRLAGGLAPASASPELLDASLLRLANSQLVPVDTDLDPGLSAITEGGAAVLYFVVSEALTNVTRHAQARRARVAVIRDAEHLMIEVEDDGVGGAAISPGGGLRGLADRLALAGGTLTVDSPPGGPTRIRAAWTDTGGHRAHPLVQPNGT